MDARKGTVIVNGLAAYEWSPRNNGVNLKHDNIVRLTTNILSYLSPVKDVATGVDDVDSDFDETPVYYNINGVRVDAPTVPGIYIVLKGSECTKIVVR
ncbi:MAG: hypothetical protein Q4C34_00615 [Bacteroidales bacterium]|nr:hypothetical protein [Bacteroidales bacterium]